MTPSADSWQHGGARASGERTYREEERTTGQQHARRDDPQDVAALLAHTSDLVVICLQDGRIVYVNPRGRAALGLGGDEDVSLYWVWDFLSQASRRAVFRQVMPDLTRWGRWKGRLPIAGRDGRVNPWTSLITQHGGAGRDRTYFSIVGRRLATGAGEAERAPRAGAGKQQGKGALTRPESSLQSLVRAVDDMIAMGAVGAGFASPRGGAEGDGAGGERMLVRPQGRPLWEWRIRRALETDGFVLVAQPIASARERRVTAYELLVRLVDEDGCVHLPGAFMAVAEETGLICRIDQWVIDQAIRLITEEAKRGRHLVLEVNVSALSLGDPQLLAWMKRRLEEAGLPPARLVLEITETAAIQDIEQARAFIGELRRVGCRFALDDFGVGFGSFYHLKHLSVDFLKIDGSFIQGLRYDPIDRKMVRAFVEVAQALDIRTVAEFVEDEGTVALLRELGVDYVQGYHIGKPRPLDRLFTETIA